MIIFITGGVRSGKSEYAVLKALEMKKNVTFIATCTFPDKEMLKRIEEHKKARPPEWETIEEGVNLIDKLTIIKTPVIIVDCLILWVANLMKLKDDIIKRSKDLFHTLDNLNKTIIIVSGEVGSGIVPENKLARAFRDMLGIVNKGIAAIADEVYLMVAGIPLKIK